MQYFSPNDTPKLTVAPVAASTIVRIISPELILTKNIVRIPPNVPYFVWPVNRESFMAYFFSILTAVWLTVPITPPATAK